MMWWPFRKKDTPVQCNRENVYASMETKELVKIISIHKSQYTPEAIRVAKAELRRRGETSETLSAVLKEAKQEEIRKKMPYEELGYTYANALLPTTLELAQSAKEWTGRQLDTEKVARELTILSLVIFQMWLMNPIPDKDASLRTVNGFGKRMSERFPNFAFDPITSTVAEQYVRATAADFRNKHKTESFPTLVPLAINRIAGLTIANEHWPAASECIYSFMEMVMKTTTQAVTSTKINVKLV